LVEGKGPHDFSGWMRLQQGRDDNIGDLARLAAADGGFPAGYNGYTGWRLRLEVGRFDRRVFRALERAWADYGGRE
jgi:hypothetical protein